MSPDHFKSFESQRLWLRPTSIADAEFILELFNSPKWLQHIGDRNIFSVADAKHYIVHKMHPQFQQLGFGNYTISTKANNLKVGICGLYDREGLEGIDIGFALLPQFEGQGYALEACTTLQRAAREVFAITDLKGITTKVNKPSQAILLKMGLRYRHDIKLTKDGETLMLFAEK